MNEIEKDGQETMRMMRAVQQHIPVKREPMTPTSMFGRGTRPFISKQFRTQSKALVRIQGLYVKVESTINRNGITGPNDIGRTWTICFEIIGNIRDYRHKTWYNFKPYKYEYFRSFEQFQGRLEQQQYLDRDSIVDFISSHH